MHRSAGLLKVKIVDEGGMEIARRSRGTPRIANRLLRRVRDYAEVKGDGTVSKPSRSTSSRSSAAVATASSMWPSARTWA